MQKELVPRVDKDDNLLGLVDRKDAYHNGWIHRGVHAVVRNQEGLYLVSQRSLQKSTWPGHFDLGLAETVKPGESYSDALQRGLQEELGIGDSSDIRLIKEKYYQEYFWDEYQIFGMLCLFAIVIADEPTFEDGEVQSTRWLTESQLSELVESEPSNCTPWLIRDWEYFLEANSS